MKQIYEMYQTGRVWDKTPLGYGAIYKMLALCFVLQAGQSKKRQSHLYTTLIIFSSVLRYKLENSNIVNKVRKNCHRSYIARGREHEGAYRGNGA